MNSDQNTIAPGNWAERPPTLQLLAGAFTVGVSPRHEGDGWGRGSEDSSWVWSLYQCGSSSRTLFPTLRIWKDSPRVRSKPFISIGSSYYDARGRSCTEASHSGLDHILTSPRAHSPLPAPWRGWSHTGYFQHPFSKSLRSRANRQKSDSTLWFETFFTLVSPFTFITEK